MSMPLVPINSNESLIPTPVEDLNQPKTFPQEKLPKVLLEENLTEQNVQSVVERLFESCPYSKEITALKNLPGGYPTPYTKMQTREGIFTKEYLFKFEDEEKIKYFCSVDTVASNSKYEKIRCLNIIDPNDAIDIQIFDSWSRSNKTGARLKCISRISRFHMGVGGPIKEVESAPIIFQHEYRFLPISGRLYSVLSNDTLISLQTLLKDYQLIPNTKKSICSQIIRGIHSAHHLKNSILTQRTADNISCNIINKIVSVIHTNTNPINLNEKDSCPLQGTSERFSKYCSYEDGEFEVNKCQEGEVDLETMKNFYKAAEIYSLGVIIAQVMHNSGNTDFLEKKTLQIEADTNDLMIHTETTPFSSVNTGKLDEHLQKWVNEGFLNQDQAKCLAKMLQPKWQDRPTSTDVMNVFEVTLLPSVSMTNLSDVKPKEKDTTNIIEVDA